MQKIYDARIFIAFLLIIAGLIWLLRPFDHSPIFPVFPFKFFLMPFSYINPGKLFSWQIILIVTGFILLAGRRSTGIVLIFLGSVFLFPGLLYIIPALLIVAGLILIINHSIKIN